MKSVKSKLFSSYVITIFIILFTLSLLSVYFFNQNRDTKSIELIENTYKKIESTLYNNPNIDIQNIEKNIDIKNLVLIIFKNDNIVFTNKSRYKTSLILEFIEEELEEEYHNRKYKDHDRHSRDFHKREEEGFLEAEDYIFFTNEIEIGSDEIEIYLGVDEKYLKESDDEVYTFIIFINLIIFIILSLLGYLLINKTIKPLKEILEELKVLQNSEDLSKRLEEKKTQDEFEELINTFNKMLKNIENNVNNIKQFSSDASHELRTPLTVIQGELDLSRNKELSNEQLREILNKVDLEQQKLQNIIKDFLLLSRLDKEVVKNKKANLDKVVFESIESNLDFLEDKNLELRLDIDEDIEVNFDEKYLQIVINNLLSNAIKYTNNGFISIKAKKDDKKIFLEIEDSGIGINKIDLEKIFERFYRVDKARTTTKNGIGLGLSIVKKICNRYSCKIEVSSELDKGSSFKLSF